MGPHIILNPHKYSTYISYPNILHVIRPSQILLIQAHKLPWAFSQILPIITHILSNLGFHKNTHHIRPQNYTISIKSPKGKIQKKFVATWHPKACCYMAILQNPLLHGTLTKPVATRHLKTRCYAAP